MEKLTKSLPLFKERNCSVSIVLDSRTRRRNACEFPLSLRFTIERKCFYLTVGSSFTEKKFSDICNAAKCKSENYRIQKEWKDTFVPKYKELLMNLNKGGILTFEMVRQCIMGEGVIPSKEDTAKSQSFIGIWELIIHELRTDDGGVRFTTAESYECALKSFRKILGTDLVKGFCISAAEIQKWKEGMHNGVKDENGAIAGKISDTTAGIYLRCCRAVWNRCIHYDFSSYLRDSLIYDAALLNAVSRGYATSEHTSDTLYAIEVTLGCHLGCGLLGGLYIFCNEKAKFFASHHGDRLLE